MTPAMVPVFPALLVLWVALTWRALRREDRLARRMREMEARNPTGAWDPFTDEDRRICKDMDVLL